MRDLPSGTVTFLFTDIEGSTKLLHELGAATYSATLADHRRVLRKAFTRHGGVEVDTQGDAFFIAFGDAAGALAAAAEAQRLLDSGPIRVRMGVHTGTPHLGPEGYVGQDVHLGARLAAAGHGGQVLLSKQTRQIVSDARELLDLGEHRLKDFAGPIWIYQLGTERFPPLKTISNTNLPRPASSFVGREREVADIGALLNDGARLVTLTGPGGTGKTRLSIEAAAELVPEFKAGVFWVALASLTDHTLVTDTIARTLGAKDGLEDHIGEREMLLLIDNLEQVVGAAPELATLVESCLNLRLLVTSRELLRVRGEVEYAVPPLADPDAAALFSTRSGIAVDDTIEELCRRLENLPLAVELAAARARVLTPKQILERLSGRLDLLKGGRDADPRQQTLRAAIEWSYDLLQPSEQVLFARLAVFRGGCALAAAEQVAGADLDTLQSLVDKSLLRFPTERFWMLETIREFAWDALSASNEAHDVQRRHADFFLALAEDAEPNLRMYSAEWLERLERDHDNLRAALEHFTATDETNKLMRLAGSLSDLWVYGGHVEEGWRHITAALAADADSTAARGRALMGAADLAANRGDITSVNTLAGEALDIQRQLKNDWGAAYVLGQLGNNAIDEGNYDQAKQQLAEAIELWRQLGEQSWASALTRSLAWAHESAGDHKTARELHEANLAQAVAADAKETVVGTLGSLSMIAAEDGRAADAVSLVRQNLVAAIALGDMHSLSQSLCRVADICVRFLGKPEAAAQLLGCFDGLREQIGVSEAWVARENEKTLAKIAAVIAPETRDEARRRGQAMAIDQGASFALDQLDAGQ